MLGSTQTISVPSYAAWSFFAPAGAKIRRVSFWYNLHSANGHSASVALGSYGEGVAAHWHSGFSANDQWYLVPTQFPANADYLTAAIQCANFCPFGPPVHTWINHLDFDIADNTAPSITALGGSLVSGGTRRGSESLVINAADQGGGVRSARVTVNGAEIASPQASCQLGNGYATRLVPCPPASFLVPVNTEDGRWALGANELEVCVYDLALTGSPNFDCVKRLVEVDNTCLASGGLKATSISAGVERAGKGNPAPSVKVKSTEGATARGTVTSATGAVPGANICMYEAVSGGAAAGRELSQVAKTKSDGTFAIQVSPGPSRKLDLVYRHNNQVLERPDLLVQSRAVPSFKAKPKRLRNGRKVRFKGRIPGPGHANRTISLQARAGKKWRTFKNVRTGDHGRFKGVYRFTQTRGRTRYVFRALVKR
ncbi:MAG: hypothetical protein ACRDL6_12725, partial [Solirubrobacterales bacterium]